MKERFEYSEYYRKNALVFIRHASKIQSGQIPDMQLNVVEEFCAKHEINVHSTFSDIGSTKAVFGSLTWLCLERYITTYPNRIQLIVVSKLDRISRNPADIVEKQKYLKKLGVTIVIAENEKTEKPLNISGNDLIIQPFKDHNLN